MEGGNTSNEIVRTEQTLRGKLIAQLRAKRTRERMKAQELNLNVYDHVNSCSSSQSESKPKAQIDRNSSENIFITVAEDKSNGEAELPLSNTSYNMPSSFDLDPLKLEPNEDQDYKKMMAASYSINDILSTELNRIESNAGVDEEDDDDRTGEEYFKKLFQTERLRIENALKHAENQNKLNTPEFKFKEEEPLSIDLIDFNRASECNPLDFNHTNDSSVDSDINICTFNQNKNLEKRQIQAERMRKYRAKKKKVETPDEVLKRKANQRQRAERSRLIKKAMEAGIQIDSDLDDVESKKEGKADEVIHTRQANEHKTSNQCHENTEINANNRMKCNELLFNYDYVDSHFSHPDSVVRNRRRCAQRARERRAAESKEETEARRLRARIAKMKHRLFVQLAFSEEQLQAERARKAAEMRLRRQKRKVAETPEQTAERKLKQVLQARKSRGRILAAETPEEIAARKAAGREYCRQRITKLKATKTTEKAEHEKAIVAT